MDKCIVLPVKDAIDKEETIKINHGIEIIRSCNIKFFITGVSAIKQTRIVSKCEDLGDCNNIIYEANYILPKPLANWKVKENFHLNLPNGSVMNYVGERTLCEKPIYGKYLGTKIVKRKVVISKENMEDNYITGDGNLISIEDVNLGIFKAKRYVKEIVEIINRPIFDGNGEIIDKMNNTKVIETSKIVYDENPREFDFKTIVRKLINSL